MVLGFGLDVSCFILRFFPPMCPFILPAIVLFSTFFIILISLTCPSLAFLVYLILSGSFILRQFIVIRCVPLFQPFSIFFLSLWIFISLFLKLACFLWTFFACSLMDLVTYLDCFTGFYFLFAKYSSALLSVSASGSYSSCPYKHKHDSATSFLVHCYSNMTESTVKLQTLYLFSRHLPYLKRHGKNCHGWKKHVCQIGGRKREEEKDVQG